MKKKIQQAQTLIQEAKLDGWLLYDWQAINPLALKFLEAKPLSRRFFYFIPQKGECIKLVHQIEQGALDHLPGEKRIYLSYEQLENGLKEILKDAKTIAMGLLNVREKTERALDYLQTQALEEDAMMMQTSFLFQNFQGVAPLEKLKVLAFGAEFKWVDSMTRLQLINAILCFDPKRAYDCLLPFLKKAEWGILLLSSQLFTSFFPNESSRHLEPFLENEDLKIRTQAALILSYYTGSKKAQKVLIESYQSKETTRQLKLNILEGLMAIRSKSFLEFFVELLDEKDLTCAFAAASCILYMLNF